MTIRKFIVPVTTAADGTATAFSPFLSGYLCQIVYAKTDYTDGVDFTITLDGTGETLWTEANVNASVSKAPRVATTTTSGVASLYASGGTAVNDKIAISRDRVKIVLAQGGNATTGTFTIILDDER